MFIKEDIELLNCTVDIPALLVKLGAEEGKVKQLYNKPDYRTNCWWRGGDNPSGLGVTFYPDKKKWLCTDFTKRTFGNIDLIDMVMQVAGLNFGNALKLIESCCKGKESALDVNTLLEGNNARIGQIQTLEPQILKTFIYGLHPYLHGRGYTPETAKHFKLGFSIWGEMIDRITIPIFDEQNRLVSIQGRSIDNETPKYKFLDGTGDSAKQVLYNLPNAMESAKKKGWLLVVEGAPSVWRLHQLKLDNVVATLSTSVTDRQIELLVKTGLHICIWFDNDENGAGNNGLIKMLNKLNKKQYRNVSCIIHDAECSPDDMDKEQIKVGLLQKRKFPFKRSGKNVK